MTITSTKGKVEFKPRRLPGAEASCCNNKGKVQASSRFDGRILRPSYDLFGDGLAGE